MGQCKGNCGKWCICGKWNGTMTATEQYYEHKIEDLQGSLHHIIDICEDEIAYYHRHSHDVPAKSRADLAHLIIETINRQK